MPLDKPHYLCPINVHTVKIKYTTIKFKSATHQKTQTRNMKGKKDNTDERKRQGQHKRQAQIWTDTEKTRQKCLYSISHTARHLKMPH